MKHIMMSSAWEFSRDPFPAYRTNLVYGRNKHDRAFLPVKDVIPLTQYTVTAADGAILYTGTDRSAAEAEKITYDAAQKARSGDSLFDVVMARDSWAPTAALTADLPILPEGGFRIIKTKEKGTMLVVPGNDASDRCLLFVGCAGGFRGGVAVLQDGTTGRILTECSAGNNCESSIEVVVLLEIGQSIAFHSSGRRTNEVYVYTWRGTQVEKQHFSKAEWDARNTIAAPADVDVEVL